MGNSIDGKTNKVSESAGVSSGTSELAGFDAAAAGDAAVNESGSIAGFETGRKKQLSSKSASKYGKSFTIEGCK